MGTAAGVAVQRLSLQVDATSAGALARGSLVDVYVNRPAEGTGVGTDRFSRTRARARGRVGRRRRRGRRRCSGGSDQTRAVQVMVPREKVRDLVAAVDDGARITLVPVPGGAP